MNIEKKPYIAQWFRFQDYETVEKAVQVLEDLGIRELRTFFSWADWERPGGKEWFDWFIGRLSKVPKLRLLPCLMYTPSRFSVVDGEGKTKTSYPPNDTSLFADFVAEMVDRYGDAFDWIQLWNESNWTPYYDASVDPDWDIHADMLKKGARAAKARGKKVALGGLSPLELSWLAHMEGKGAFEDFGAIGFHYAPSWPARSRWFPLETEIAAARALFRGFGKEMEIWLDEAGISTNTYIDHDEKKLERRQVEFFEEMKRLSAERVYWYTIFDDRIEHPTDDAINMGVESDITAYHFGMIRTDGSKKPLYDHWKRMATKSRKEAAVLLSA